MDVRHFFHNPIPFTSVFELQTKEHKSSQWFIIRNGSIESLDLIRSVVTEGVHSREFTEGTLYWTELQAEFHEQKTNKITKLQRDSA